MAAKVIVVLLFVLYLWICCSPLEVAGRNFTVDYAKSTFLKDGKPFRYISGSIHYTRVPPFYWKDRLLKMYAAGLDAIQLYVPWNSHQPDKDVFDFQGINNLTRFIKTAQEVGLLVLVRAGPYMDGEWEFGGLPAWILKEKPDTVFRTMDPVYIKYVDVWLDALLPKIEPLLYVNGGPVIMVQIENEYGSYNSPHACDKAYLKHLHEKFVQNLGNKVVLYTTDGCEDSNFKCGPIPGVLATTDFGTHYLPPLGFGPLHRYQPHGPLVNSEFYTGWLDHWGKKHQTVNPELFSISFDLLLNFGASVNLYMFEGGTNFGFWNGANDSPFQPVPTSYDYDAPLTEAGDITEKYNDIRKIISRFKSLPPIPVPPSTPKAKYGTLQMKFVSTIQDTLGHISPSRVTKSRYPISMELGGQYMGFMLYRHVLKNDVSQGSVLSVPVIRDRGYVMIDKVPMGIVVRDESSSVNIHGKAGQTLDILVENQGHITFNKGINGNSKGLLQNITLDGKVLEDWMLFPICLENTTALIQETHFRQHFGGPMRNTELMTPSLYMGLLNISSEPQDTYLDMTGWTKGQAFVGLNNLGRYWPRKGPQVRLFMPKPFLQKGYNVVLMFELESSPCQNITSCVVRFLDKPLINGPTL